MAKGRIVVNEEACKGCRLCTTICPAHLIQIADTFNSKSYRPAKLVDPEHRCTGCTLCAMICPDVAIIVFREVKVKPQDARPIERAAKLQEVA
jgi:2-oxoglutarate ferredoxin oxidoreductase subunit delta